MFKIQGSQIYFLVDDKRDKFLVVILTPRLIYQSINILYVVRVVFGINCTVVSAL